MRKTEFLQELREALDGEVSAAVIQNNASYYDQYISQESAKGRTEEEVIEEIGSPRLIARTIIDSSESAGETYQGDSYQAGTAGNGRPASSYDGGFSGRDDSGLPPNFHYIDLNKWYWKLLLSVAVIVVLFVLFVLVGGIFAILIRLAGPILLIWLIYTFIKSIWK